MQMGVWVQCMLINDKASKELTECNNTQPQWLFNFSCDVRKAFVKRLGLCALKYQCPEIIGVSYKIKKKLGLKTDHSIVAHNERL